MPLQQKRHAVFPVTEKNVSAPRAMDSLSI